MADTTMMRADALQEGVSGALAILYAIEAGDMFRALPEADTDRAKHNHGCWLLGMLDDHLTRIQQQVDVLETPIRSNSVES